MKARLCGLFAFVAADAIPGLLLSLALLLQHPSRPDRTGDMLVALWLAAVAALGTGAGFAAVLAFSKRFAALRTRHAALIGGALGIIAPLARLFLLSLYASAILPLFHSHAWLATLLMHLIPGVFLGGVAILLAGRSVNR